MPTNPSDIGTISDTVTVITTAWAQGVNDWVYNTYTVMGSTYTATAFRAALGAAASDKNADITSLSALTEPTGFRNKIINGNFGINQRVYVSGAAIDVNLYGHDRWKMATAGDTYTFATVANVTTITIPAGKVLRQVVEGLNLLSGTYTLSWDGTAQGKIGAGALSASGVTGSITGGTNTTIEFGPGTVSKVQLELGSVATPFEHRPIGIEMALCQRYLPAYSGFLGAGNISSGGLFQSATNVRATVVFPVVARVPPTGVYSPNIALISVTDDIGIAPAASALGALLTPSIYGTALDITFGGGGSTLGRPARTYFNNTAGQLFFLGCEL